MWESKLASKAAAQLRESKLNILLCDFIAHSGVNGSLVSVLFLRAAEITVHTANVVKRRGDAFYSPHTSTRRLRAAEITVHTANGRGDAFCLGGVTIRVNLALHCQTRLILLQGVLRAAEIKVHTANVV
eukprot:g68506.t1